MSSTLTESTGQKAGEMDAFDPRFNIGQGLLGGVRWFDESLQSLLEAEGFPRASRTQSMLLGSIDIEGGTSASELARRVGVTRQAVHQEVRRLADLGLLEQRPDPDNRAAKRVCLTDYGLAATRAALKAIQQIEQTLAERLGARRLSQLRRTLFADWGPALGGD